MDKTPPPSPRVVLEPSDRKEKPTNNVKDKRFFMIVF
jgi:hypothetical protein